MAMEESYALVSQSFVNIGVENGWENQTFRGCSHLFSGLKTKKRKYSRNLWFSQEFSTRILTKLTFTGLIALHSFLYILPYVSLWLTG